MAGLLHACVLTRFGWHVQDPLGEVTVSLQGLGDGKPHEVVAKLHTVSPDTDGGTPHVPEPTTPRSSSKGESEKSTKGTPGEGGKGIALVADDRGAPTTRADPKLALKLVELAKIRDLGSVTLTLTLRLHPVRDVEYVSVLRSCCAS